MVNATQPTVAISTIRSTESTHPANKEKVTISRLLDITPIGTQIFSELGMEDPVHYTAYSKSTPYYDEKNGLILSQFANFLIENDHFDRKIIIENILFWAKQKITFLKISEDGYININSAHKISKGYSYSIFPNFFQKNSIEQELESLSISDIESEYKSLFGYIEKSLDTISETENRYYSKSSYSKEISKSLSKVRHTHNKFQILLKQIDKILDCRKSCVLLTTVALALSFSSIVGCYFALTALSGMATNLTTVCLSLLAWTGFQINLVMLGFLVALTIEAWKKYFEIPQFVNAVDNFQIQLNRVKEILSKIPELEQSINTVIEKEEALIKIKANNIASQTQINNSEIQVAKKSANQSLKKLVKLVQNLKQTEPKTINLEKNTNGIIERTA